MFSNQIIFMFVLLIPSVKAIMFNYPSFESNSKDITLQGNASISERVIELTTNRRDANLTSSVGRVVYTESIRLYDTSTGKLADFTTRFTFRSIYLENMFSGDGIALFIAGNGSTIPCNSSGGHLGIVSEDSKFNSTENPFVAVEIDTFPNAWDPSVDHVGIDINSIKSVTTWNSSSPLRNDSIANAWVRYNSSSKNMSVYLTFVQNPIFSEKYFILSFVLDLRDILPEWVTVGISGATGASYGLQKILSWDFNSTEFPLKNISTESPPKNNSTELPLKKLPTEALLVNDGGNNKTNNTGLIIGLVICGCIIVCGFGLLLLFWWKRRDKDEKDRDDNVSSEDDYENGTGPKRFSYTELVHATNDFSEVGKLGEGGFGGVYKGIISDANLDVAVKKVSQGSKQGKKEFISEVKIISRLRHRNLVQLHGWCKQGKEFLLVYEYMSNGSLDTHLFKGKTMLNWNLRFNIALGLASALLYLHELWEQCVVHRDIKSSNIMLDSSFNAKLGDFGLARLVDHDLGEKTTMLAGTMGYLAPECVTNGRATKEADVYSFGVVALEIACGRRAVEHKEEQGKVGLVSWVWDVYGSGRIIEAADPKLQMVFDEQQIVQLMIVGLWCANIDPNLRPSIRKAISVLNFESPLPNLPREMSMPTHFSIEKHACVLSHASSSSCNTDSQSNQSQCSCCSSSKGCLYPKHSSSEAFLNPR